MIKPGSNIFQDDALRNRTGVFADRAAAGEALARTLEEFRGGDALVLGVPSGGVPVAAVAAERLGLELDVAVASKITPPWNSEYGYGAVAYDGTVVMNESALPSLDLSEEQIRDGMEAARQKVARRVALFRGEAPGPRVNGRTVILVDDGLATGYTVLAVVKALRKAGAGGIILAVPTAHAESAEMLAREVEAVYCPNIRGGYSFAVAAAYRDWRDIDEQETAAVLDMFRSSRKAGAR